MSDAALPDPDDPDPEMPSSPSASPADKPSEIAPQQSLRNKLEQFLKTALWSQLLMPVVVNSIMFFIVTYFATSLVTQAIKRIEFDDKVRSVGITAQVEIIKDDVKRLRELTVQLRRANRLIDDALTSRATGRVHPKVPEEALRALADMDDQLHFVSIRILSESVVNKSDEDRYLQIVADARAFARMLHDCLAPVSAESVQDICAGVVRKYRHPDPGDTGPALALYHFENAMLAVLRQLPQ